MFEGASSDTVHLSVEQTVRRSLVHKRSIENVLLTEIRACGNNRFLCAGRIPTAHRFFNDAGRTPQTDILYYTELGRQASLAISHQFLDVSPEDIFIFEGSEAAVTDAAWRESVLPSLDLVVVEVDIRDTTRRRNNAISRVVAEHRMSIGGERVFHGTGAWTMQPASLYRRLRRTSTERSLAAASAHPHRGVRPGADGARRTRPDNVVISPPKPIGGRRAFVSSLIVDHRHPYFFDHPCDHVPGMLLLEGCAQLALTAFAEATSIAPGVSGIGAYDVNFVQFVECGVPTTLTARVNADPSCAADVVPSTVQITIAQRGAVAGTATVRIASPIRSDS
jgi:hypothetical protein